MGKKGGKGKGKKDKKEKKDKVVFGHDYYENKLAHADGAVDDFSEQLDTRLLSLEEVTLLLEQLESDKYDVTSYINRMIHEKERAIVHVNERRDELIDVKVTDALQLKLKNEAKEIDETMKESNHAKTKVKGKLNDMAEVSFEKKKLENRIAKYKQQIIDEDGEFQELLYHTEKDSLKSRDQKKADMIKKVRQLTADFKKLSNAQVSETSKKAIRQNQNLWEGLNRLDAVARRAIDNNERTKQRLQTAQLEAKVLEHSEENTDIVSGTLPAFRRTNARKAAEIQRLVLSYRDTEERIAKLVGRHNDLTYIESEIGDIIENNTIAAIANKVDFLAESMGTIQTDLDEFDRKLNRAHAKSEQLESLGKLVLVDLSERERLETTTAQMILKIIGEQIDTVPARQMKDHYRPGDGNFIPRQSN